MLPALPFLLWTLEDLKMAIAVMEALPKRAMPTFPTVATVQPEAQGTMRPETGQSAVKGS